MRARTVYFLIDFSRAPKNVTVYVNCSNMPFRPDCGHIRSSIIYNGVYSYRVIGSATGYDTGWWGSHRVQVSATGQVLQVIKDGTDNEECHRMRDLNHSDKRNLIVDMFRDKTARAHVKERLCSQPSFCAHVLHRISELVSSTSVDDDIVTGERMLPHKNFPSLK